MSKLEQFMTILGMLIALLSVGSGWFLLTIGGLILGSLHCAYFGAPLLLAGFFLFFLIDRT